MIRGFVKLIFLGVIIFGCKRTGQKVLIDGFVHAAGISLDGRCLGVISRRFKK